jgi:hypothetical protein
MSSPRLKLVAALGMHAALWNKLAVEVRHLLKKPDVRSNAGPRSSAVAMFWLSSTGAPNAVVSFLSICPLCGALDCELVSKERQPVSLVVLETTWSNSEWQVNMTVLTAVIPRQL